MRAIVDFFLQRPSSCLARCNVLAGYIASQNNQREGFRSSNSINSGYRHLPGAAAEDVEKKLTIPIEDAIEIVDGVVGFKTTITENRSTTIVDLDMALDSQGIDIAKRDIEDAIAGIRTFPAEMTDEPMVGKIIPGKLPILEIALSGLPNLYVEMHLILKEAQSLEGVGEVTVVGYRDPEVRVFYDPERGRALVTIQEVIGAIEGRNIFSTGGKISEAGSDKQVVLRGLYEEPQVVEMTPLRARLVCVLRIGDVARVEKDSPKTVESSYQWEAWDFDRHRKKDNADIIDTVDSIMAEVGIIKPSTAGVGFRQ